MFTRLAVFGLGLLATYDLFHARGERILPLGLQWLMFLGPILLLVGGVAAVRRFAWGENVLSRRRVLTTGVVMMAVGVYPWFYTPWIIGGRPGNEGAGMLGTLIFIFVGLPGLAVTLLAMRLDSNSD